jgi:hypothetical protein
MVPVALNSRTRPPNTKAMLGTDVDGSFGVGVILVLRRRAYCPLNTALSGEARL